MRLPGLRIAPNQDFRLFPGRHSIEDRRKWLQQFYTYPGQGKHVQPFVMVRSSAYPASSLMSSICKVQLRVEVLRMRSYNVDLMARIRLMGWGTSIVILVLNLLHLSIIARWLYVQPGVIRFMVSPLFAIAAPALVLWTLHILVRWLHDTQTISDSASLSSMTRGLGIVASSMDAIFTTDDGYRITAWSNGAEILFGYTSREIVGRPIAALWGPGPAAEVEVLWLTERVSREGFVRRHETTCRDIMGQPISVDLTMTRSNNEQGQVIGTSVIIRDITTRKQREEEIRHFNAQLYKQAVERTNELAEKVQQLAEANKDLQQLDHTRSEFVALVSHQIRAPLTNMAAAVQRMQGECGLRGASCARFFTIFEQQILRLERLVQDVLSATLIEADQLSFVLEPISIPPIVQLVVSQVATRNPDRSIYVRDKPGMPLVYADRDRVAEVLVNLLDNADKYTLPDKDVFVEVRATDSEVTVSVRDSGPGLPQEDLDRVFEKFYRADSSDSQPAYGYGLGLYICHNLVSVQGGHIWAENHPDGGAVFSFSLPVWQVRND